MTGKDKIMNCLCDLFDNEVFWIILIALAVMYCSNNGGCGCGIPAYTGRGCGCSTCGCAG